MISGYADRLHIYTDGSKDNEGHVACSVYVPEKDVRVKLRLSDRLSVFTAELAAIKKALDMARDYCRAGETRNIVIFSDSLSAIESLNSIRHHTRSDIIRDIDELMATFANMVTVSWVPAHVGIHGNEVADKLAKEALSHASIDIELMSDQMEITDAVNSYVLTKWQSLWTESRKAGHNRVVQPLVSTRIKFTDPNRRKEVSLTRLRLVVCKLNNYLKQQKNHPTGLCSTCGVPETIEHYLMYCRGSNIFSVLQKACIQLKTPFDIKSALNNKAILNLIYENVT